MKRSYEHYQPVPKEINMSTSLTANQQLILSHAHENTEGKIVWFPESIKGGARQKVIDGLANRGLITSKRNNWFISAAGYEALGVPRKDSVNEQRLDSVIKIASAPSSEPLKVLRTRDNSKQAQVIAMLKRLGGATIPQICETTGWQPHTVRGLLAGSIKKKLGLNLYSTADETGQRVYRVV